VDSSKEAYVEIIDFKRFPQKMKYGAIGMVFGKVTHGLTANFFSELIHSSQLDADGNPNVSVSAASRAIMYEVSSEISVALRFLQGCNWFDENVSFITTGVEPFSEVEVHGWRHEWGIPAKVDVSFYLEDVCEELELDGLIYSQEWYYAKASHLYFKEVEVPDVAMTIGILLSQMWWKLDQEVAALRGHENLDSLDRANKAKKLRMKEQASAKNTVIQAYWHKALAEHGAEIMRRDSNAAQAIFAMATEKRPRELQIRSTGKIIGAEAIRKRLVELRRRGKIG
jgi:hypothetical protein